jgi:hypothetical protein
VLSSTMLNLMATAAINNSSQYLNLLSSA